ncbi:MAG: ABC transporter ATP-binding protein [Verrucomicrobiales bacterium]
MNAVELSKVCKSYGEGEARHEVLSELDLTIGLGERLAIVGSSGCGKSTLLNIIGTLDRPERGEVLLFGENYGEAGGAELAKVRSEDIGFIFQLHHLLPQCSVLENVLVPTIALSSAPAASELEERARQLLERVGLENHLGKVPAQLSGGERQRVAVVRALINEPRLLLADEPTGALDEDSALALTELLVELNEERGVSVVMVTHDLRLAQKVGSIQHLKQGSLQ